MRKMAGMNKATRSRNYKHKKQGATVRNFPGSAGGSMGIAHKDLMGQIHGKRVSRSHNRKG